MSPTYDAIVVGLGGMGSAAAYHLARRGKRVLGIERFSAAHDRGSSHGRSRIIRLAYFEDPAYVPLLLRAYELWEELEKDAGRELLTLTGGIMMGSPESTIVAGSRASAEHWQLPHEMLDAQEITRRWPTLTPGPGVVGLFESKAGFVRPEVSVAAHLERAGALGAELRFEEKVTSWRASPSGEGVTVSTERGVYEGDRLVIAPGAWAPEVLADLGLPLRIERQVQYWFAPTRGIGPFAVGKQPIYVWEAEDGVQFYGFPAHGPPESGVKVAFFRMGSDTNPDELDREVHAEEVEHMRRYIAERVPQLNGTFLRGVPCMYTTTPDEHFVIARHPDHPQVSVAAGFSGHGFKFVTVVGEILADLALEGATDHPIALFDPARFR
jgi:sarcosine oxidase